METKGSVIGMSGRSLSIILSGDSACVVYHFNIVFSSSYDAS